MTRPLALVLLLLASLLAFPASANADFPRLTGRIVDQANLLDGNTRDHLSRLLEQHERSTTEQVVVVTLPNLRGASIEDYGYRLGRYWHIGERGRDNGVLLIVARDERRVRIEVGYGLEGRLTDAQASQVINKVILPAFRAGDFRRGITDGTVAILQVLGGNPMAQHTTAAPSHERKQIPGIAFFVIFVMIVIMLKSAGRGGRRLGGGRPGLGGPMGRSPSGTPAPRGGGFRGGGGGFGGGGASGGW